MPGIGKRLLGIAPAKQEPHPPQRADELADFVLQDHTGEEVRLGSLWEDGPAVLVFLRHYG